MAATGQQGAIGVVSAAKGEVFAKGADGQMRRLAVGDKVYEGDVIVTANGSTAEITPFNGPVLTVQEQQTVAIDAQVAAPAHDATAGAIAPLGSTEAATVIQNVAPQAGQDFNATLADEATAAGLAGGDGNQGGRSFVDLMRIVETVPTVGYDFPANPPGETPILTGQSATPTTNTPETPPADPLANNDYSGLAMSDSGWKADGNVIWNDIPVAGAPIHISAVNGVAVAGDTATVRGAYGTLTLYTNDVVDANGIHQMGDYHYVSDGIVFDSLGNVTTYGTDAYGQGDWENPDLDISTLNFGSDMNGVGGSTGVGVDMTDDGSSPLIDAGESLVFSLKQPVNSLTVSLGEIDPGSGHMAYWYAYGENGARISSGTFEGVVADSNGALSLPITNETAAIKTLVIHNNVDNWGGFEVTGLVYHGIETFSYTIADSNGGQSTAELVITPDQGFDMTAANGGHIVVGTDNSAIDLRELFTQFSTQKPTIDDVFNVLAEHPSGGSGNDVLSGGVGNDVLTGGGGVDTFVWHLADAQPGPFPFPFPFAVDIVKDFGAGDVLELNDLITDATKVEVQPFPAGSTPLETLGDATGVVIYETATSTIPVQVILLEGYTAADTGNMEKQLQQTSHFTG